MSPQSHVLEFILDDGSRHAPPQARRDAKRCLLDLLGVAVAGATTDSSRIARDVAVELWPPGTKSAALIFDGRRASVGGVAFAGAQTIDSFDAHDGYKLAKGHAGVAILPALLAVADAESSTLGGQAFLDLLILGYEIACRVAVAQHRTCPEYHASGSWNAVGTAAVASRLLGLNARRVREALGIAEYYGPRSQIMRVVDDPSMVKDSSGWGAMAGVTAAYLAQRDFTGAPVLTIESPDVADLWDDLGRRWLMSEQYMKLWPTCRWAQPSVKAALELAARHGFQASEIARATIYTFHEACRLAGFVPTTTDEAQYAIAFPTACALVRGRVGVDEVAGTALRDAEILDLASRIQFVESQEFNAAFPHHRRAKVVVELADGRTWESPVTEPPGDPESPLTDQQIEEKFFALAEPLVGAAAQAIRDAVGSFDDPAVDLSALVKLVGATSIGG